MMNLGESYREFYAGLVTRIEDRRFIFPQPIGTQHRSDPTEQEILTEQVNRAVHELVVSDDLDRVEAILENNPEVLDKFQKLKRQVNDWEQEEMQRDLEINQVPETKGENLAKILIAIGEKLGVPVKERNIIYAMRVGIRWGRSSQTAARARRITVRLTSRKMRDALVKAARRHFTTSDVGLPGPPQRISIAERLTQINRSLLRMARTGCRNNGWHYLWVKQGRIYVRKDKESNVYAIRNYDNVERVFNIA